MSVHIIKNFFSEEQVGFVKSNYLDSLVLDKETGYFKSGDSDRASEDLVNLIKKEIELTYEIEIPSYQFSVVKMLEGSYNGIHEDTSDYAFNGEWQDEVGISALLYLSDFGKDFTGGELVFPQHDISYEPESGSLVFFRGDSKHRHGVERVLSGERSVLVLFF